MIRRNALYCLISAAVFAGNTTRAFPDDSLGACRTVARQIMAAGLRSNGAYTILDELTRRAGSRLSGSKGAAAAVELTRQMMVERGFENVRLEEIFVPHWERGKVEKLVMLDGGVQTPFSVCAIGGSIGTPTGGITAEVVEVRSFEELRDVGENARGKIVFFNRPMDPTQFDTFAGYGGAVNQRAAGAIEAAKVGGVAALVRSVTLALDDVPHTGSMGYADSVRRIPGAAISTKDANRLSSLLRAGKKIMLHLQLSCRVLPDAPSANVLGELRGKQFPDEVIVVGGHLDSWDKGTGAHDDGAGCAQALEALHLLKQLGLVPRRTIRAVMFMNEENGMRGGLGYAAAPGRKRERHVAALEADRGGFAPRGFTVDADSATYERIVQWKPVFDQFRAGDLIRGGSGVDISPLVKAGVPGFGLDVENHRYFDYHHSANDTIDKVYPRELEVGAALLAVMCYLISQDGL